MEKFKKMVEGRKDLNTVKLNKIWSKSIIDSYRNTIYRISQRVFGVSREKLMARSRKADLVTCRRVLTVSLCNELGLHPDVVCELIQKDRTTILHYIRIHPHELVYNALYKESYNRYVRVLTQYLTKSSLDAVIDENTMPDTSTIDSLRLKRLEKELEILKEKIKFLCRTQTQKKTSELTEVISK